MMLDKGYKLVRAHLAGRDDGLVTVGPLLDRVPRFADLLDTGPDEAASARLRRSELIGARSAGQPSWTPSAASPAGS